MADNNHEAPSCEDLPYILHPQPVDRGFASHRPRALSVPPNIPTIRARDDQNGIEEKLGNQTWSPEIDSSAGAEKESYSRFYHPNFEVITRSIPEDKIQELKRILIAFASSLEGGRRALSRITNERQVCSCIVIKGEKRHCAFAVLQHISGVIDVEAPCSQHGAGGGRGLRHRKCLSFTATNSPMDTRPRRATDEGLPQDFAPKTELVMPLTNPTCDATSPRLRGRKDNHESDSGSSIDFLHLARQTNSDAVRLLEDEYDRMMADMG